MAKTTSGTFKSYEGEKQYFDCYDAMFAKWPVSTKENRVKTTYGETNIVVCGKNGAPPVVLLHPINTGSVMWAFGIETLSANYHVYAVDTIGDAGKSRATSLPRDAKEYSVWLDEVLEQLDLNEVILIGASYGGSIALRYAIERQEKITRLILIFPPFGLVKTQPFLILKMLPYFFAMNEKKAEKLLSWMCSDFHRVDEDLRRLQVLSTLHFTPYTLVMKPCSDSELQKIGVPMTFIVGENEIFFNRESALDRIKKNIPHCRNVVIPGMKHYPTKEELAEIDKVLGTVLYD